MIFSPSPSMGEGAGEGDIFVVPGKRSATRLAPFRVNPGLRESVEKQFFPTKEGSDGDKKRFS